MAHQRVRQVTDAVGWVKSVEELRLLVGDQARAFAPERGVEAAHGECDLASHRHVGAVRQIATDARMPITVSMTRFFAVCRAG